MSSLIVTIIRRNSFWKQFTLVLLSVGLVVGAWSLQDSIRKWLLLHEGYVVICDEPTQRAQQVSSSEGNIGMAEFEIENLSSEGVVISGLESSCTCVSAVNAPLTVNPRSIGLLTVAIDAPCQNGKTMIFPIRLFVSRPCPRADLVLEFGCLAGSSDSRDSFPVPKPDSRFSP